MRENIADKKLKNLLSEIAGKPAEDLQGNSREDFVHALLSNELRKAAQDGRLADVRRLAEFASPDMLSAALEWAAENGHAETVLYLAPKVPIAGHADAIFWATNSGHANIVKMLLPKPSKLADTNGPGHALLGYDMDALSRSLANTAVADRPDIAQMLIDAGLDQLAIKEALTSAASSGSVRVMRILMDVFQEKSPDTIEGLLFIAATANTTTTVAELLPMIDPPASIASILERHEQAMSPEIARQFRAFIDHGVLSSEAQPPPPAPAPKI